jgi:hypothetical protein
MPWHWLGKKPWQANTDRETRDYFLMLFDISAKNIQHSQGRQPERRTLKEGLGRRRWRGWPGSVLQQCPHLNCRPDRARKTGDGNPKSEGAAGDKGQGALVNLDGGGIGLAVNAAAFDASQGGGKGDEPEG